MPGSAEGAAGWVEAIGGKKMRRREVEIIRGLTDSK